MLPSIQNASSNVTLALNAIETVRTVWYYWPLILIFGLLAYGFVAAQRREPDEFTYY